MGITEELYLIAKRIVAFYENSNNKDAEIPQLKDMKISQIRLSTRLRHALMRYGLNQFEDNVSSLEKVSMSKLLKMKGVGLLSRRELEDLCFEAGIKMLP